MPVNADNATSNGKYFLVGWWAIKSLIEKQTAAFARNDFVQRISCLSEDEPIESECIEEGDKRRT
jgi:hypothetical protein